MIGGISCVYEVRPNKYCDVKEFIMPYNKSVQYLAKELLRSMGGNIDLKTKVEVAYNWVAVKVRYETDKLRWGVQDYWQTPEQTLTPVNGYLFGDCEDTSFLLISLLIAMGVPKNDVRVAISDSHAWVEAKINNSWYAFETTSDEPLTHFILAKDVYKEADYYKPKIYVYEDRCVHAGIY